MVDKNLYANDLIFRNPGFTFDETVINSQTKVDFKNGSSVIVSTAQKLDIIDAYRTIREDLLKNQDLDFISTTTQRDLLSSVDRNTRIYNITVGRSEIYNGTGWQNVARESVVTGITASPTKAQGAGLLTADLNIVNTVAGNDDNVTLPFAISGIPCIVINKGAKKMDIFPNTDDDLGQGVNQALSLGAGSTIFFHSTGSIIWEAL